MGLVRDPVVTYPTVSQPRSPLWRKKWSNVGSAVSTLTYVYQCMLIKWMNKDRRFLVRLLWCSFPCCCFGQRHSVCHVCDFFKIQHGIFLGNDSGRPYHSRLEANSWFTRIHSIATLQSRDRWLKGIHEGCGKFEVCSVFSFVCLEDFVVTGFLATDVWILLRSYTRLSLLSSTSMRHSQADYLSLFWSFSLRNCTVNPMSLQI